MSAASLAQVKERPSQVNPQMSQLINQLTELVKAPKVKKSGDMRQWDNLPQLEYSVRLWGRKRWWCYVPC